LLLENRLQESSGGFDEWASVEQFCDTLALEVLIGILGSVGIGGRLASIYVSSLSKLDSLMLGLASSVLWMNRPISSIVTLWVYSSVSVMGMQL